ncbi:hypothetical protein FJU08_03785 [Martelella alba]|uniref:Uncharacterized protein n=1 Tax=Martelella alba TaxID=2590451 RepID=A0A506UCI3_9HYPH|nr:hypothetical protein [Martelella alba]TPW32143.1 hypothetical protein FJU08_03785 [Martelella alba]
MPRFGVRRRQLDVEQSAHERIISADIARKFCEALSKMKGFPEASRVMLVENTLARAARHLCTGENSEPLRALLKEVVRLKDAELCETAFLKIVEAWTSGSEARSPSTLEFTLQFNRFLEAVRAMPDDKIRNQLIFLAESLPEYKTAPKLLHRAASAIYQTERKRGNVKSEIALLLALAHAAQRMDGAARPAVASIVIHALRPIKGAAPPEVFTLFKAARDSLYGNCTSPRGLQSEVLELHVLLEQAVHDSDESARLKLMYGSERPLASVIAWHDRARVNATRKGNLRLQSSII